MEAKRIECFRWMEESTESTNKDCELSPIGHMSALLTASNVVSVEWLGAGLNGGHRIGVHLHTLGKLAGGCSESALKWEKN